MRIEILSKGIGEIDSGAVALVGLLALLALMVVPVPRPLVDFGLVLSLGLGLLILGAALRAKHPLELTSFPSLVLVATLLRIGLNVATTRWILSTGDAGTVVRAFGEFAAGGDFFVGFAVWIVITILLVVVVAKGSERVAEVAARFSLDGMPGRQMAVDADMRAGVITFDEARARRGDLQREARLYGAMDGALKFVKGDTMAGIAITVANLIVGMALGVSRDGLSGAEAMAHYGLMCIGDGLSSQIPSLLTAVAAGIMVTRVPGDRADGQSLMQNLRQELVDGSSRWRDVSLGLALLGALPGLPTLPFLSLSAILGAFAYYQHHKSKRLSEDQTSLHQDGAIVGPALQRSVPTLLAASDDTPVVLELGAELASTLVEDGGAALAAELQLVALLLGERRGIRGIQIGVVLNAASLRSDEARVLVLGDEFTRFRAPRGIRWWIGEVEVASEDHVFEVWTHPLSGAKVSGYDAAALQEGAVLEGELTLARRVAVGVVGAMWEGAERMVRVSSVHQWLQEIDARHPGIVDAVIPEKLSVAGLSRVLREMVRSSFPIRDLVDILDALARASGDAMEHDTALAIARGAAAGRLLSGQLRRGVLIVWVFPAELVARLDDALLRGGFDAPTWVTCLRCVELPVAGMATLLVPRQGRRLVEELVRMSGRKILVVAMEEVPSHYETLVLGHVQGPELLASAQLT